MNILTTRNPIVLPDDLLPRVWRRTGGKFDFLSVAVKRWHSWLRHCTTSRKVTSSIPDEVIGIFYGLNRGFPSRNEYQGCLLEAKATGT
jgi:hypothetical protein